MKKFEKLVKNNMKYVPFLLALIISYLIFSDFSSENSLISNNNIKKQDPINTQEIDIVDCNSNFLIRLTSILLKCSLAFLFGGMISDGRYIYCGAI